MQLLSIGCRVTVPRMQNYCSLDVELLSHGCVFSSRKCSGWNKKHFFEFLLQTSICRKKTEGFQNKSRLVVGVDGKVEEGRILAKINLKDDNSPLPRLYCRDRLAFSPFLHKFIDLFTKL